MSTPAAAAAMGRPDLGKALMLEFPQSVAVYDTYADAQKAVDFLADHEFPVANLAIVGTDLKTFERVTGRRTWGTVIAQGALSGVFMGLLVGVMLSLFVPGGLVAMLLTGLVFGVGFGILNAAISYGLSGGRRDFQSVTQTMASRYEVLGEHKVAQQARGLLREMPGERARQWNGGQTGVVNDQPSVTTVSAPSQPTGSQPTAWPGAQGQQAPDPSRVPDPRDPHGPHADPVEPQDR